MKMSLKKKILMVTLFFFVLTVSIVGAVILPTIKSIKNDQQQIQDLRVYLEKRHERVNNLRTSLKKLDEVRANTANYQDHIFSQTSALSLVTTLETLAIKDNVSEKINNSNLDKYAGGKLVFNLTVTGAYPDMINYLADLEALPYFLNVNQISISQLTDRLSLQNGNNLGTMNLEISLYGN